MTGWLGDITVFVDVIAQKFQNFQSWNLACCYVCVTDTDMGSDAPNKLPFQVDIPGSCGYIARMTDGVMRIYTSQMSLDNDVPVNYPCPDLMQFLADQNLLFCLIADGPL